MQGIYDSLETLPPTAIIQKNGISKLKEGQKLPIIIPAYNEENTICFILDKIRQVKLVHNIEKENKK
jgi:hypothetical protein